MEKRLSKDGKVKAVKGLEDVNGISALLQMLEKRGFTQDERKKHGIGKFFKGYLKKCVVREVNRMRDILRVNMSSLEIKTEDIGDKAPYGGRSLIAKILLDEVDPGCNPLGEKNKLIIATGLFNGTDIPCSGRLSFGSKSPLTGGIKESNVGGNAAHKLARMGIKAIVIEGMNDGCWLLYVGDEKTQLISCDELKGKKNYQVSKILRDKYGEDISIIAIGPAGEQKLLSSSISVTTREGYPSRHAARGGLGAVMGSKGIKAVVIKGKGKGVIKARKQQEAKEIVKNLAQDLVKNKRALKEYGTATLVEVINSLGGLPTRNFSSGSFEKAKAISGESLKKIVESRGGKTGHPCHTGCVIQCSNIYHDEHGNYLTSGLEYETIALIGSNCGIGSLDTIAKLERFCDDFGLDTMEFGAALGVAMEAGALDFGDDEKALKICDEIEKGSYLGRIIANGAWITGKVLGVDRVPVVKKQGISGYDPRVFKGTGVTYATSPMGADHTAGNCLPGRGGFHKENQNGLDTEKPDGQVLLSSDLQIMTAVFDIIGQCFFVGPNTDNMETIAKLLNTYFDWEIDAEGVIDMARQTLKMEAEFNNKAGFTPLDDDLPEFFRKEPLPPKNLVFDVPQTEIKQIYKYWDSV